MISALVPVLLQAALRALLAAGAVWAGLRLLRVANVLVQKSAWGLVLVAALAMPLLPRLQPLPGWAAFTLPAIAWNQLPGAIPAAKSAASPAAAKPAARPHQNSTDSQSTPPAPNRYPSPWISRADSDAQLPAAVNSMSDEAPAFSEPASEARNGLKGTGFSPSINPTGKSRALAPEAPRSQTNSIPTAGAITAKASAPNQLPVRLAVFALLLYLAVFSALFLRLLFGLASALRLWMTAEQVLALPEAASMPPMRLRSSPRVASPVNIGSGIVLPADYSAWDEQKLRIVLAHERSHIRQGDFYLQLLAGLYASLFWFSPLGWWLKRKLHELGEAISDCAGLEEAASRSSYAQLLLEFAALPRPTLTGVAMARTSHLSQRIERLLNESSFRQAFAAGGRRALVAVLLVPAAIFASTALVRVEAATPAPAAQVQTSIQTPVTGQSTPDQVTDQAPAAAPAPAPAPAPDAVPAPPAPPAPSPEPAAQPAPPAPPAFPVGPAPMLPQPPNPAIGAMPPLPPMPPALDQLHINSAEIAADIAAARAQQYLYRAYNYTDDGDPYAIVGSDGKVTMPNGRFFRLEHGASQESIEKARKMAHGPFLWFQHEGKSYIVDDPTVVAQIEAMNKPLDDLGAQMRDLGKQMRDLGEHQRELGRQMRDINVPTPDLSKEIADLNAAAAALKAKQGATITRKDLSDLQREIGRIQGQLGALQGRIGAQQGNLGGQMGKFGEQQGKLGGEMGKLGAQMGQIARENRTKIKGIITDSLSNGKAKPVD